MTDSPRPMPPTDLLTVPEAAARLRVSRWMVYRLIQDRQLHTIKIGTRRLVRRAAIDAYLDARSAEDDS